jgi:hypothetical protein
MAETDINSGASNAQDFQPQTRDPQSGVASGLQNTSANLQTTTTNGSTLNQQPSTTLLRIPGSNDTVSNTTQASTAAKSTNYRPFILTGIILIATAAVIIWIVRRLSKKKTPKPSASLEVPIEATPEPGPEPELELEPKPVLKARTKPKKKSTKKKQSKKKRR